MISLHTLPSRVAYLLIGVALLVPACSDDPVDPSNTTPVSTDYEVTAETLTMGIAVVWGRSRNDIYAGGSMLLHYDGGTWQPNELPTRAIRNMWGTSDGDVYVADHADVWRFDGARWNRTRLPDNSSGELWGADNGELFVADFDGNIHHYDGSGWSSAFLSADGVRGVCGSGVSDVYAFDHEGLIFHYDGADWSTARPDSTLQIQSSWKATGGPLYIATWTGALAWDGIALQPVDFGFEFRANGFLGNASQAYCVGYRPDANTVEVLRLDGAGWTSVASIDNSVDAVSVTNNGAIVMAAQDGVWIFEGGRKERILEQKPYYSDQGRIYDVWGTPELGLYAVGSAARRYQNGEWTDLDKESITDRPAYAIFGTSAGDLYAVGDGMILRYDGTEWTWESGGFQKTLVGVWADAGRAVAVGYNGAVLERVAGEWVLQDVPIDRALFCVWGWENGGFAAGEDGVMVRSNGDGWHQVASPVSWTIYNVWADGPDHIFICGANAYEVCFYNGRAWIPMVTGVFTGDNNAIWGASSRDLFVGQDDGHILHYAHGEWTQLPRVTGDRVTGIWGTSGSDLLVATGSALLHYHRRGH